MTIGSLGDVYFTVDANAVATFDKMKWTTSATYGTHKVHGKKALLEFTGLEPDEITFNIKLSAFLGVNPSVMLDRLTLLLTSTKVVTLIIGTKVYGSKWVLTKIEKNMEQYHKDGTLLSAEAVVTIEEYAGG